MFSTQYIDEVFLEELRILNINTLVLGIDQGKNFEEKMENESTRSYEDLSPAPNKTEEERLIVASLFTEFRSKYFMKENVVNYKCRSSTKKNKYYCPDFVTNVKSLYLPTIPLWTMGEIMDEKIKQNNKTTNI